MGELQRNDRGASGTPAAANVGTDSNITIAVSDGTTTVALPKFAIAITEVGSKSATLSWKPPTVNSNGSASRILPDIDLLRYECHRFNALHHHQFRGCHDGCRHGSEPRYVLFRAHGVQCGGTESKLSNVVKASL